MEKSSQNGGNQLFNGDVSDNNNSVAYQASLSSSHPMMGEKDTSKASDCNDSSSATSGKKRRLREKHIYNAIVENTANKKQIRLM